MRTPALRRGTRRLHRRAETPMHDPSPSTDPGAGRDGQQVDAAPVARDLLAADQHPFAGQDARLTHDHVFQLLFADELAVGQQRGLGADLPEGVLDGHGQQISQRIGLASIRRVGQQEDKLYSKCLILNMFQLPPPLSSSRGDNNETGLSAALGLV